MNNSIKRNFIYNSAYQLLIILIPLITTPYISRVLGAQGTGIYSYAYSVASYFVMFIILGLNNYGNRSIAKVRENQYLLSKTFWSIYCFQIICGIIVVACYILYTCIFSDNILISTIMIIYVLSACIDINWFFFGLEQFKVTVIRNTVIKILTVLAIFIFIKSPADIYKYTAIYVIGMILSQIFLWFLLPSYISFVKIDISDIVVHIRPNLILFIPVIAVSLYKIMDKIMLGAMTNKTQVGYYESCERVIAVPLALVTSLGTVMLPRMTNLLANNNKKAGKQYVNKSIIFAMFLSTSMSFGIMAVSREFVPIFYGDGFTPCIMIFQILLPSGIFIAFANVIRTQYLIPQQKDSIFIISVITGAIINITLNLVFIPNFGAAGAACGTFFAEFSVCFVQAFFIRKELPIKKYVINSVPFLLSGLIMYMILINTTYEMSLLLLLILKVILGFFIYSFVLILCLIIKKAFANHLF